MECPVTSEGIRSGVNWIRWKSADKTRLSVLTSNVFPSPGTPSMRTFPSLNRAMRTASTSSFCPTNTLLTSRDNASNADSIFEASIRDFAGCFGELG